MTTMGRDFKMTAADAHAYKVNQPLRAGENQPVDARAQVDRVNKATFDTLAGFHSRSNADGYFQSHPFSQMFTTHDLATDEATLNNNYMRLIFGGKVDPEKDEINGAYKHATKQRAEAAVTQGHTLENMNPSDFVKGASSHRDSLLKTFADQRRFFKGQIDTDAERAMKARVGHEMTAVTFYGKNVGDNGQAGRFHHITGQHGHLQTRPDPAATQSWWNLSSRTHAPDGAGGEVPLNIQNILGDDPRAVSLTDELRVVAPEPQGAFDLNDLGSYPGKEIDSYITNKSLNNPTFEQQFRDNRQRRWV